MSGSFCGAAILQRLSHHSCACDGVPLLRDDGDDYVDKNDDDDDDITVVPVCIATYFHQSFITQVPHLSPQFVHINDDDFIIVYFQINSRFIISEVFHRSHIWIGSATLPTSRGI